jgi:cytochrome c biogenesis protein CcmG, thiol:disulfide interchange protein DsbE
MNIALFKRHIAALAAALAASTSLLAGQPKAGDAFPSLADFKFAGDLPDLTGKVVVVDFWASWCGPCKASFPALAALHNKYSQQGVVVVGVSIDEDESDMAAFVKKAKPPFTIVRDVKQKLASKLDIQSIPTTFILGKDGRIMEIHNGFGGDSTAKQYTAAVEAALGK